MRGQERLGHPRRGWRKLSHSRGQQGAQFHLFRVVHWVPYLPLLIACEMKFSTSIQMDAQSAFTNSLQDETSMSNTLIDLNYMVLTFPLPAAASAIFCLETP